MANPVATCPYCNSQLTELTAGPRPLCPRCGEPLPGTGPSGASSASVPPSPGRGAVPSATGHSNRAVAGIILAVMGAFFLVGLGYALWTQSFREKNHPKFDGGALATSTKPFELPGLGYLPADTNLVAAVRPADLLDEGLGKRLLASPRPRFVELALSNVEKWTGTTAANIDHLVVGASIVRPDRIPSLTLVVQTRLPYHPATIAKALGSKAVTHQDRPLFRFSFDPAGQGALWCMNERVMVLVVRVIEAVKIEDLDTIPHKPYDGASGLPAPVREVIARMDKDSLAWVAGHVGDPAGVENILGLLQKGKVPFLAKAQSFGVWLVPEEKTLRLSGALRGRDEEARSEVAALLKGTMPGVEMKMTEPTATTPAAEQLWVQFQMRVPPQTVRELLQK